MVNLSGPIRTVRMARFLPIALILLAVSLPVARAVVFEEGSITTDGFSPADVDPLITNGVVYWNRGSNSVAKWTGGTSFSILWNAAAGENIVDMDAANGRVVWATSLGSVFFHDGSSVISVKGAGNEVVQVATDGSKVVHVENRGGTGSSTDWEVFVWSGSGNPSNISNNSGGRDTRVDISNGNVVFQRQQFAGGSPLRTYFWPGSGGSSLIPIPAGMTNPWDRTRAAMGGDYVVWGTGHDGGHSFLLYHIPSNTTQDIPAGSIVTTLDPLVSNSGTALPGFWRTHAGVFNSLPAGIYYEIEGQELINIRSTFVNLVDGPSGSLLRISPLGGGEHPSFSGEEAVWAYQGDIRMYAPEGRVPFPFVPVVCDSPPTPTSQLISVGVNFTGTIQGSSTFSPTLTLSTTGVPSGATLTPPLPIISGATPVSTILSWTPTAADIGPHPFVFTINSGVGQATCEFTLDVCSPSPELCDGIDNNCSNVIDEGFGVGDACVGKGECGAGVLECAGPNATRCSTEPGGSVDESSPEICDGLDNDCDGAIDSPTVEVNDGLDNQCAGEPGFGLVDEITGDTGFNDPSDPSRYSWPPQTDATLYRVARSTSADFSVDCTTFMGSDPFVVDPEVPVSGGSLDYLVRPLTPNLGSWGRNHADVERTFACGTEFVCDDGGDDDGDGLLDCDDPDCASAPVCNVVTFSFLDTAGDDIFETALFDFLNASPVVGAADFFFFEIDTGTEVMAWCSTNADFYRDTYLTSTPGSVRENSGNWDKWYHSAATGGAWILDPDMADNRYGNKCEETYSWCSEFGLGNLDLAVRPAATDACESQLDRGSNRVCSDGTWVLTIQVGETRLSTCGF